MEFVIDESIAMLK